MTNNEIIKALECCSNAEPCVNCPYQKQCDETDLAEIALDLINRQKAEIERLEDLNKCYYTSCQQIAKSNHEIKAEAVKEFAERVKDFMNDVPMHSEEDFIYVDYFELRDKIDNLVKEMVGEG